MTEHPGSCIVAVNATQLQRPWFDFARGPLLHAMLSIQKLGLLMESIKTVATGLITENSQLQQVNPYKVVWRNYHENSQHLYTCSTMTKLRI